MISKAGSKVPGSFTEKTQPSKQTHCCADLSVLQNDLKSAVKWPASESNMALRVELPEARS